MWKKFNFFTAELLQSADPGSPLYAIQALDITSVSSGKGNLIFGDSEGGITMCDQDFSLHRFIAYESSVDFVYQFKSSNILLTIGNGNDYRSEDDISVSRNLVSRFRSSLSSNETYSWMLDDLHISHTVSNTVYPKAATLKIWLLDKIDADGKPLCLRSIQLFEKLDEETITTLAVQEDSQIIAFGCKTGNIYSIQGDILRTKKVIPTLLPSNFQSPITVLLFSTVASETSLYLYASSEQRFGCYAFPHESKKAITFEPLEEEGCAFHCGCLTSNGNCMICRDTGLFGYSPTGRQNSYLLENKKEYIYNYEKSIVVGSSIDDNHTITIYNLENTCEEFSMDVMRNGNSERVLFAFAEWNLFYYMTEGHTVYLIRKKNVQTRLNILYDRQLFKEALELGKEWNLNEKEMSLIHLRYGNALYNENKKEEAIYEYIETIGVVDALLIIRKYLDIASIHQLIMYLEELHRRDKATADYTLLLMNSYVKLHDNEKIQAFVYQNCIGSNYDKTTAINCLSSSGYYREALYIAQQNHLHQLYISIQLNHTGAYKEAIKYIASLSTSDILKVIKKYGKQLMDNAGELMLQLLVYICLQTEEERIAPENVLHCFIDCPKELASFLKQCIENQATQNSVIWNTYIELLLRHDINDKSEEEYENEIMVVLEDSKACYDDDDVLILLENNHFEKGLVFMYKKLHMCVILLHHYMATKMIKEAIELCQQANENKSLMMEDLLEWCCTDEELNEEERYRCIQVVYESNSLALLKIIQICCESPFIKHEMIKQMIMQSIQHEQEQKQADEEKRHECRKECKEIDEQIAEYETHAHSFHQTRCIACGLPLETPVVHFLCGHSYHKACITAIENGCPRCGEKVEKKEMINNTAFLKEIKEQKDGFAYVADRFGDDLFREDETEEIEVQPELNSQPIAQQEEFDEDAIPIQALDI